MPPDHVINPTYPCSCTIAIYGNQSAIVYCPTHAVAHALAVALRNLEWKAGNHVAALKR